MLAFDSRSGKPSQRTAPEASSSDGLSLDSERMDVADSFRKLVRRGC